MIWLGLGLQILECSILGHEIPRLAAASAPPIRCTQRKRRDSQDMLSSMSDHSGHRKPLKRFRSISHVSPPQLKLGVNESRYGNRMGCWRYIKRIHFARSVAGADALRAEDVPRSGTVRNVPGDARNVREGPALHGKDDKLAFGAVDLLGSERSRDRRGFSLVGIRSIPSN